MRWYAIPSSSCRLLERFRVTIPEVLERVCLLLWLSAVHLMSVLGTAAACARLLGSATGRARPRGRVR